MKKRIVRPAGHSGAQSSHSPAGVRLAPEARSVRRERLAPTYPCRDYGKQVAFRQYLIPPARELEHSDMHRDAARTALHILLVSVGTLERGAIFSS